MTYILYKYQSGKPVYLSTTGKWIKSACHAAAYSLETAQAKQAEIGCCKRVYSFRN